MAQLDLVIENGRIIDPEAKTIEQRTLGISKGKLIRVSTDEAIEARERIDATGCYISPGWIDSHVHVFKDGTEPGFAADLALIPMGVTAAIDGGSSGTGNWAGFKREIVDRSIIPIFYSVNVSRSGQITEFYPENVDPAAYDVEAFRTIFMEDAEHARGLKLRYGAEVVAGFSDNVLDKALALADELGCSITVHVTNPPCPMEEIVEKMRPGDLLCHIYQGKGSTIIDDDGQVKRAVFEARERGVYFDSADARINHCYHVIRPAIKGGFLPDIISTDMTKNGLFHNMCWGLPVVLSKWLNLGVSLLDVIAACTVNPAAIHRLPDGIGTWKEQARANLTIFRVEKHPFHLQNRMGESFDGTQMILPQVTIINGIVRWKSLSFPF